MSRNSLMRKRKTRFSSLFFLALLILFSCSSHSFFLLFSLIYSLFYLLLEDYCTIIFASPVGNTSNHIEIWNILTGIPGIMVYQLVFRITARIPGYQVPPKFLFTDKEPHRLFFWKIKSKFFSFVFQYWNSKSNWTLKVLLVKSFYLSQVKQALHFIIPICRLLLSLKILKQHIEARLH